ncbi:MAG: phosphoenolpyruvate carboxylase [Cyclobacteriaceae bacterium]
MSSSTNSEIQNYNKQVGLKFQLYNSLFTSLPFHKVEKTGILLSSFLLSCEEGYEQGKSPLEIIEGFFQQHTSYNEEQEQIRLLFRFVQYAERQVVLFDAVEDAAYRHIYDLQGRGTLKHLQSEVLQHGAEAELAQKLKDFSIRLVLTAHPTQFYPSEVLGIINDLSQAIVANDTTEINSYLQQLGKTPFFKKEKPTPYHEAVNLIWFLENRFYPAAGQILTAFKDQFRDEIDVQHPIIRLGFWPGGDRDGNPFVKVDTTLRVATALRKAIVRSYYQDIRRLKRRLTFKGVANILAELERKLYENHLIPDPETDLSREEIIRYLEEMRSMLLEQHNGLFLDRVDQLLRKVSLFGLHFASLDIRQDSSVHSELLEQLSHQGEVLPSGFGKLSEEEKIQLLLHPSEQVDPASLENELFRDTIESMQAVRQIQQQNGEPACHRYIISHSTSALDVISVYGLFLMSGWPAEELSVDIVPLFESIEDLRNAADVMRRLYENETYRAHLQRRANVQTIMVGFSDGTKDGGYLMANWSIYKAKEALTRVSEEYGIQVIFFDGRGGPPARGGGRTHQFYASMGSNIANKEIQLTIQGQTISSNFGTIDSAQYNMEQLMHAGISNSLFGGSKPTVSPEEDALIQQLANESFRAYSKLKNHPDFLVYLNEVSPLRYYGEANIGSRPSKRKPGKLNLDDLRAVPYVGSWSQLKQNLPGYYGVGTAFEKMDQAGKWEEVQQLYRQSPFFRALMNNCEMAMTKSFFPLTAFLADHPRYGTIWNMIHEEYERSRTYLLRLSGGDELMHDKQVNRLSIQMRQRIELPLLSIQQYALHKIREMDTKNEPDPLREIYEKLVVRCSFGIINAGRNSA